jgi:hypothetical protein
LKFFHQVILILILPAAVAVKLNPVFGAVNELPETALHVIAASLYTTSHLRPAILAQTSVIEGAKVNDPVKSTIK